MTIQDLQILKMKHKEASTMWLDFFNDSSAIKTFIKPSVILAGRFNKSEIETISEKSAKSLLEVQQQHFQNMCEWHANEMLVIDRMIENLKQRKHENRTTD